jgi:hypothetical protein
VVSINRSGDLAASAVLAAYQIAGAIDLHHNDVNNMSGEEEDIHQIKRMKIPATDFL